MNVLERRILKIESKVLDKKHHEVFIIIRNNNLYVISNYEEKGKNLTILQIYKIIFLINTIVINIFSFTYKSKKIKPL